MSKPRPLIFLVLDAKPEILGIGGIEKAVLLQLMQCMNPKENGDVVWPSQATLAAKSGFGKRTVFRGLTVLEQAGLIKKRISRGRMSNRYSIYNHVIESLLEQPTMPESHGNHARVTRLTMPERRTNYLKNNLTNNLSGSTTSVPNCEKGAIPISDILEPLKINKNR